MVVEVEHPRSTVSWPRAGMLVAAAAAAPFAVGALLYDPAAGDLGGPQLLCPFQAATGLPCPLCGSTRAVVLAAHGDAAFLEYNAIAVLLLVAVVAVGLAGALGGRRARDALAGLGAAPVRPLLVLVAVAWAWTLTHTGAITS